METTALTTDQQEVHVTYNTLVHERDEKPSHWEKDQIWYILMGDRMLVTRIATHDGITWQTGQPDLIMGKRI